MPEWWNWQTRQTQNLVPVKGVRVRLPSLAFLKLFLLSIQAAKVKPCSLFYFSAGLKFIYIELV